MREIIYDIGGGINRVKRNLKQFKQARLSGTCLNQYLICLDYDSLTAAGAMMGSGLVVMDEDTCMVDVAKFSEFLLNLNPGKCTPLS